MKLLERYYWFVFTTLKFVGFGICVYSFFFFLLAIFSLFGMRINGEGMSVWTFFMSVPLFFVGMLLTRIRSKACAPWMANSNKVMGKYLVPSFSEMNVNADSKKRRNFLPSPDIAPISFAVAFFSILVAALGGGLRAFLHHVCWLFYKVFKAIVKLISR